jgi:hypothetical protein
LLPFSFSTTILLFSFPHLVSLKIYENIKEPPQIRKTE